MSEAEVIKAEDVGRVTLPVPQNPGAGARVNLGIMKREDYNGSPLFTSLPLDTPEQVAEAFNVVSGESESLTQHEGEFLEITDYVLERGTFQFEDKPEPELGVRVWLILKDGRRLYSGSASITACLERVINWFGLGPWDPPMVLAFIKSKTQKGRDWWNVERDYSPKPV